MTYLGRHEIYGAFEKQILVGDGSTFEYDLNYTVASANSLLVFVDGVALEPQVDYNISSGGTKIVFVSALSSATRNYCLYLGTQTSVPRLATQEPDYQSETATEGQTDFTITRGPVVAEDLLVFVNTVIQRPTTDFTVSGTTLSFGTGLTAGDDVDIFVR